MSEIIIKPLGTVSPYSKGSKNCPGFLIEYEGNKIMLDCGNGTTSIMNLPDDLKNLKVFITHLHPDHYGDVLSLIQAYLVYKRLGYIDGKLEVFIPSGDIVYEDEYYTDSDGWGSSYKKKDHILDYRFLHSFSGRYPVKFNDFDKINIDENDIKITSMKMSHPLETFAFRIDTPAGSVVYSADTGTKNNLREFAKNCDLLICESTYLRGQCRAQDDHLYAHEAGMIARDANVGKLLLTHFWPEIDKELYLKEALEYFPNTEVAEEGKKLVLRRN